ncbi:MAG TPA: GFA family protein [Gammaproteobacteria bacterium]|nr:GFA family protein [Gammaproteobacteria bacterium]
MFEGGCLCGEVRYRVDGEPLAGMACHCRDCQYLSGGGEANVVVVPRQTLSVTAGKDRVFRSTAESGTEVWRSFCPTCGTPLFAGNAKSSEFVAVKAGSLDDPALFTRQGHVWVSSAPAWHLMEPGLPTAEKNPSFL